MECAWCGKEQENYMCHDCRRILVNYYKEKVIGNGNKTQKRQYSCIICGKEKSRQKKYCCENDECMKEWYSIVNQARREYCSELSERNCPGAYKKYVHNDMKKLDDCIRNSQKLGISYGKYMAMKKQGIIK